MINLQGEILFIGRRHSRSMVQLFRSTIYQLHGIPPYPVRIYAVDTVCFSLVLHTNKLDLHGFVFTTFIQFLTHSGFMFFDKVSTCVEIAVEQIVNRNILYHGKTLRGGYARHVRTASRSRDISPRSLPYKKCKLFLKN